MPHCHPRLPNYLIAFFLLCINWLTHTQQHIYTHTHDNIYIYTTTTYIYTHTKQNIQWPTVEGATNNWLSDGGGWWRRWQEGKRWWMREINDKIRRSSSNKFDRTSPIKLFFMIFIIGLFQSDFYNLYYRTFITFIIELIWSDLSGLHYRTYTTLIIGFLQLDLFDRTFSTFIGEVWYSMKSNWTLNCTLSSFSPFHSLSPSWHCRCCPLPRIDLSFVTLYCRQPLYILLCVCIYILLCAYVFVCARMHIYICCYVCVN